MEGVLLPTIALRFLKFSRLFNNTILMRRVFACPKVKRTTISTKLEDSIPLLLNVIVFDTVFMCYNGLVTSVVCGFMSPEVGRNRSSNWWGGEGRFGSALGGRFRGRGAVGCQVGGVSFVVNDGLRFVCWFGERCGGLRRCR